MRKKQKSGRSEKEIKRAVELYRKYPKEIKVINIDEVKLWKDNPNDDYSSVSRLAKIFEAHGQITPIVVWRKNMVCYKGNHSLLAMKELGQKKIEVTIVDFPNREAAELYGLADNISGKMTTMSDEAVVKLMRAERIKTYAGDEEELRMITGFSEKEYKSLILSTEEMPTELPKVDIEGFVPSKTDFVVIQFEDKEELEFFKEMAGIKVAHQRVVPFELIRKYFTFKKSHKTEDETPPWEEKKKGKKVRRKQS